VTKGIIDHWPINVNNNYRHMVYTPLALYMPTAYFVLTVTGYGPRIRRMEADELKQRREALGMTQRELSTALEVDVMTVSRWERGERTIPSFLKLALQTIERERGKKGGKKVGKK
jgi:DNA-binding transcriptional regulator YiaG